MFVVLKGWLAGWLAGHKYSSYGILSKISPGFIFKLSGDEGLLIREREKIQKTSPFRPITLNFILAFRIHTINQPCIVRYLRV